MLNEMNEKAKQELSSEKANIEADLADYAILDPQTNKWVALREQMNDNESDENDKANISEEYERRSALVDVMQNRLDAIQEKLSLLD